ncbi:MAG: thioredoxin [Clostridiales bacterium]|nr:thioredoxin [Clostridiales bacterium]
MFPKKQRLRAGFCTQKLTFSRLCAVIGYNKPNSKKERRVMTLTITKENFDREVLQSDKPVLLDFWAAWCGPCRMVSPIIDEIAQEMPWIKVGKVNVDEQPELAQAFRVMSIPMLAVVKDGQVVSTAVGARPKADILKLLGL